MNIRPESTADIEGIYLVNAAAFPGTAGSFDLHCEYDVPPEMFMAMELEPGSLDHTSGLVRYHPAFAER